MHDIALRSPSRLSVNTVFSEDKDEAVSLINYRQMSRQVPSQVGSTSLSFQVTPAKLMDRYCTESSGILGEVHDLTGNVAREGKYPCAHGGFC